MVEDDVTAVDAGLRKQVAGSLAKKSRVAGKSAELLMFVPDVFILLWRLSKDRRVSGKDKVLLASAIAYFILPIDIIPEAIVGPIGYLDDLVFAAYVLNKILNHNDDEILREHWSGSGDVLDVIRQIVQTGDSLVATGVLKKIRKLIRKRE
jgi:uncharacterized membrane protein YkvA (DUF1232 family)